MLSRSVVATLTDGALLSVRWRVRVAIRRWFFRALGLGFAGALTGLVVRLLSSGCFLARAIHGFFCFPDHGLAGFFRFLANRFSSLFCFLTYCFESVLNCFACFLRAVLDVLNYAFLAERSQRDRRNESSN
jgi:hypothetical protein